MGAVLLSFDPDDLEMSEPSATTDFNGRYLSSLASAALEMDQQTSINKNHSVLSLGVQEYVDSFMSRHAKRELLHEVPPIIAPRGCNYDFTHGTEVLVDEIFCPNWCGDGQDFTFTTTTLCKGDDCENFNDCRVNGCTDNCGPGANDCPCDSQLRFFEEVCEFVCKDEPIATSLPTRAPSPSPTGKPTVAPTTPMGTPTLAPTSLITPAPVEAETPPAMPLSDSQFRQKVNFVSTVFSNNEQGMPVSETSRGVITTSTGFSDIVISGSEFTENDFGNPDNRVSLARL